MPPSEGKRYIALEGRALGAATPKAVARFLCEDVMCRHGCSGKFVMDGGPENKGIVEALTEIYKIKRVVCRRTSEWTCGERSYSGRGRLGQDVCR